MKHYSMSYSDFVHTQEKLQELSNDMHACMNMYELITYVPITLPLFTPRTSATAF